MKQILYLLFAVFLLLVITYVVANTLEFIANHYLLFITFILIVSIILSRRPLRLIIKFFSRNWIIFYSTVAIFIIISFISNSNASFTKLFNSVSPVKIIYEDPRIIGSSRYQNYAFPFGKAFLISFLNDLPIKQESFPFFHYWVNADYRYHQASSNQNNNGRYIHHYKEVICVFKNIGRKAVLINRIQNISFIREGEEKPIDNNEYVSYKINLNNANKKTIGLVNILNENDKPIVIYPSEEIILYDVLVACTNEELTIETEIKYYEWPNPSQSNLYTYRQIDRVKLFNNTQRSSFARTKNSIIKKGNSTITPFF